MRVWMLASLAVLVAVACSGGDRPEAPPRDGGAWSIDRAKVLFTARRDGTSDLYVLDRASGETERLTRFGSPEGGANAGRVDPGGGRVAFQVVRGSDYEIYVMDLEGGSASNLTSHPEYDVSPAWSPGGTEVAFMSTRGFELGGIGPLPGHVYVLDLGSRALRQVTREPLTSSLGPSDWSADGSTMLIARAGDQGIDVYSLAVDTGLERRLTQGPASEYSAAFSSDGTRIAFHSEIDEEAQIVVMELATGARRAVTSGPGLRYYPRWSPDDEWILFTASDDGAQYDVRAVHLATGKVVDLIATPDDEREGQWMPLPPQVAGR